MNRLKSLFACVALALPWVAYPQLTYDITYDSEWTGAASTELIISSGSVTMTDDNVVYSIDTEGDAATDDLDTITQASSASYNPQTMILVTAENSARDVVLKDGTGNLSLGSDITLSGANSMWVLLHYADSSWRLVSRSDGAASGVQGPGTSTVNGIPLFADTSGNLLKDSPNALIIDDGTDLIKQLKTPSASGFSVLEVLDNSDTAHIQLIYDGSASEATLILNDLNLKSSASEDLISNLSNNLRINGGLGDIDFSSDGNTNLAVNILTPNASGDAYLFFLDTLGAVKAGMGYDQLGDLSTLALNNMAWESSASANIWRIESDPLFMSLDSGAWTVSNEVGDDVAINLLNPDSVGNTSLGIQGTDAIDRLRFAYDEPTDSNSIIYTVDTFLNLIGEYTMRRTVGTDPFFSLEDVGIGGRTVSVFTGTGTPEGSILGDNGDVYFRTNATTGLSDILMKRTGSDGANTGWASVFDSSGGDVVGPGTSAVGGIPYFDNLTGDLLGYEPDIFMENSSSVYRGVSVQWPAANTNAGYVIYDNTNTELLQMTAQATGTLASLESFQGYDIAITPDADFSVVASSGSVSLDANGTGDFTTGGNLTLDSSATIEVVAATDIALQAPFFDFITTGLENSPTLTWTHQAAEIDFFLTTTAPPDGSLSASPADVVFHQDGRDSGLYVNVGSGASNTTWASTLGTPMIWGDNSIGSSADTRYLTPGYDGGAAPLTPIYFASPVDGVIRNLTVVHNITGTSPNNIDYSLYVNGVATALTVSLASNASTASNMSVDISVSASDLITIEADKGSSIDNQLEDIVVSILFL